MPLSKGHKNKMKMWRKESPGNHIGRKLKYQMINMSRNRAAASSLLIDMFAGAGIHMRTYAAFQEMMKNAKLEQEAALNKTDETQSEEQ